jgi:hypothetical protein
VLSMAAPHVGPALLTGTADLAGFVHPAHAEGVAAAWTSYAAWTFFGPGHWGAEGTGIACVYLLSQIRSNTALLVVL